MGETAPTRDFWTALGPGEDPATRLAQVRRAHELFVQTGTLAPATGPTSVRSVVRDSWMRSVKGGVNPSGMVDDGDMSWNDFLEYRARHPMAAAYPLVRSLMLDEVSDSGVVVALTDDVGRLLWVEGDHTARDQAGDINFVEGALWAERVAGTNAPGLALEVDHGVQIFGAEHFSVPVQEWNCVAAPVHDPVTGAVIGVIDVTGGERVAAPFALSMVKSVVAAVESELRIRTLTAPGLAIPAPAGPTLLVLDGDRYYWRTGDGPALRLSRRHAEILVLLGEYPDGLGTEEIATMLAEDGIDPVTVRAEISRLRRDLGADLVASRPYRLTLPVDSDISQVRRMLRTGDVSGAIEKFGRGGLLSASLAPGLGDLFEELKEDLRSAVLTARDPELLRAWTASVHGREDLAAWRRWAQTLTPGHRDEALVKGRVRLLDRRFGI
ncbi:transcriptional regulator [Williamsia soli]|uniref:transcriptional regulator n=1 Tax=Williamsia soli TaxID=364929 RepID=UPI001F33DC84|nr:transcriptional regulator [Williamsia soli]